MTNLAFAEIEVKPWTPPALMCYVNSYVHVSSCCIMYVCICVVFVMKTISLPSCDCDDNSDDSGSLIFIILFAVAVVINIVLTTVIICFMVKVRKISYSPNDT